MLQKSSRDITSWLAVACVSKVLLLICVFAFTMPRLRALHKRINENIKTFVGFGELPGKYFFRHSEVSFLFSLYHLCCNETRIACFCVTQPLQYIHLAWLCMIAIQVRSIFPSSSFGFWSRRGSERRCCSMPCLVGYSCGPMAKLPHNRLMM